MSGFKQCSQCGKTKPLSLFARNSVQKGGRRSACKACERPMQRNCMLKYHFGVTLAEYDEMFEAQGGVCAICGRPERRVEGPGVSTRLCVDHDHKTGEVRQLLCRTCNSMLGLAEDNIDYLLNAIEYLRRHNVA